MPGVVGQRVLHRLHDVRHRVEPDHVAGAIGRALGAADRGTGQRIDHVERQLVRLRVRHRRQHREDADPVGDEIRRVLRAHDALAERRDDEGLERVQERRIGVLLRDQLDQVHVARRVEEVDAAEARPHRRRQRFRQRVDREPRGVRREDRVRREMRRDLRVEVALPVHPLGDRLDHEVAAGERCEIAVVVRRVDVGGAIRGRQRRGLELREPGERLVDDAVGVAFLRGEIEQDDGDAGVREVRGDLRAHDAGAEDRDLANQEIGVADMIGGCARCGPRSARGTREEKGAAGTIRPRPAVTTSARQAVRTIPRHLAGNDRHAVVVVAVDAAVRGDAAGRSGMIWIVDRAVLDPDVARAEIELEIRVLHRVLRAGREPGAVIVGQPRRAERVLHRRLVVGDAHPELPLGSIVVVRAQRDTAMRP